MNTKSIHPESEHQDNDDMPIGRVLSRRDVLALFGAIGTGALVGCATRPTPPGAGQGPSATASFTSPTAVASESLASAPACIVSPVLTVGPYFVEEKLNRSDIRTDPSTSTTKEGALLQLTFRISLVSSSGCKVLPGTLVDVWHCDAQGIYSDIQAQNTVGQKFLRGYQVTDDNGSAKFTTIYPGWYTGRAVHVHFKIRSDASATSSYEFISQLFFDEDITDQVHAQSPYASKGTRDTKITTDMVWASGNSNNLLLAPVKTSDGYAAAFDVGIQIS